MKTGQAAGGGVAARGTKRRSIVTAVALVLTAVLAVVGFKINAYVRHDQRFCAASCHAPKDGLGVWHTRGHQDVACQSCHTTPASTAYALLWKKAIGGANPPR